MLDKLNQWKKSKIKQQPQLTQQLDVIPKHIAIIMDGNGRWAKSRGLPRVAGHKQGMETVRTTVKAANKIGIEALTLYAFSTENWKRPPKEVEFLLRLPNQFLSRFLPELIEENVKVTMIGTKKGLPTYTLEAIEEAIEKTKNNTGLVLNFALNYGSRFEMVEAIKRIVDDVAHDKYEKDDISEETVSRYLMTSFLPDPDLLIRTSGELRISNFLLWQIAYSELYFTDVLWPDFTEEHFYQAIEEFSKRSRRFGGV